MRQVGSAGREGAGAARAVAGAMGVIVTTTGGAGTLARPHPTSDTNNANLGPSPDNGDLKT